MNLINHFDKVANGERHGLNALKFLLGSDFFTFELGLVILDVFLLNVEELELLVQFLKSFIKIFLLTFPVFSTGRVHHGFSFHHFKKYLNIQNKTMQYNTMKYNNTTSAQLFYNNCYYSIGSDRMADVKRIFKYIEWSNLVIIFVFLVLFTVRLTRLRHMALTNAYVKEYPWIRILFAMFYVVTSISMLFYELKVQYFDQVGDYFSEGGGGECFNSLVLLLHAYVLREELRKQQKYTPLHLMYMVYLLFMSAFRVCTAIYDFYHRGGSDSQNQTVIGLSSLLMLINIILLIFWIINKMPVFLQLANMTRDELTTRLISGNPYEDSMGLDYADEKIAIPTIMAEKGFIRIIIQASADDQILKNLEETSTYKQTTMRSLRPSSNRAQHLEIISNKLYSASQIHQIYSKCNKFNLQSKISFKGEAMSKFYPAVKKFIEQLFQKKQVYKSEILALFEIPEENIEELVMKAKQIDGELSSRSSRQGSSKLGDYSAMLVSVQIVKYLFIDDHYTYFMRVKSMDEKDQSQCEKRYSQIKALHEDLIKVLHQCQRSHYLLPQFPEKYIFNNTAKEKVEERRRDLQKYLRSITNDYEMMMNVPEARELMLNFLSLKKIFAISPRQLKFREYFESMKIKKEKYYRDPDTSATFYEFSIFRNGIFCYTISRRFREFVQLHEDLYRWMKNCQIFYKFIVLPEKHLYKSEHHRHDCLHKYLCNAITIKDVHQIYAVSKFLDIGRRDFTDTSGLSLIEGKRKEQKDKDQSMKMSEESNLNSLQSRLSALIDELGDQ